MVLSDVDYLVFYDKPLLKFKRLLETYLEYSPKGFRSFVNAIPVWLKEKLYLKSILNKEFSKHFDTKIRALPKLLFNEHHRSHAASAFYPSPFGRAGALCLDGVAEWATSTIRRVKQIAGALAKALSTTGPFNVQFLTKRNTA